MNVTPYYLLSHSHQQHLYRVVQQVLPVWAQQWLNRDVTVTLQALQGNQRLQALPDNLLWSLDGVLVSVDRPSTLAALVWGQYAAVYDQAGASDAFNQWVQACARTQIVNLLALISEQPPHESPPLPLPAKPEVSPYVRLQLAVDSGCLTLWLGSSWMATHFPIKMAPTADRVLDSLQSALTSTPVPITLLGGEIELTVAQLAQLKQHDVLMTPLPADAALPLYRQQQMIGTAYLGACANTKVAVLDRITLKRT